MELDQEIQTYEKNLSNLVKSDNNKYVLIKNTSIIDIFESYNDALKFAYNKFGNDTFLIKQIQEFETPLEFTSTYFAF